MSNILTISLFCEVNLFLRIYLGAFLLFQFILSEPIFVQSFSSSYALVLGGYGPGYEKLTDGDIVKHNRVCSGMISKIPNRSGRFLGDTSGLAEFVNDTVIFCRQSSCWKLNIGVNKWTKVGGFNNERRRAASVTIAQEMIVLGGQNEKGVDLISFEKFNSSTNVWDSKPEWSMSESRSSFCTVALNRTALVIIGGYRNNSALDTVEILDTESLRWSKMSNLPSPRYGHSCLELELRGRKGILVSGGALTGSEVLFLDLGTGIWENMTPLQYHLDGHKMVLVEGIPFVLSWDHIEQFDGQKWTNTNLRLSKKRSAFTVTSIPGHLFPNC